MARTIKVPAWKFKIPRLPSVDPTTPDVFDEMTLQEHLIELRDRIMIIMAMEQEFDLEIKDEDAENIRTVGDAVKYIEEHAQS